MFFWWVRIVSFISFLHFVRCVHGNYQVIQHGICRHWRIWKKNQIRTVVSPYRMKRVIMLGNYYQRRCLLCIDIHTVKHFHGFFQTFGDFPSLVCYPLPPCSFLDSASAFATATIRILSASDSYSAAVFSLSAALIRFIACFTCSSGSISVTKAFIISYP